jgi:enamine deaminase RidA (YjgF/YER057c/UK114 family)
MRRKKRLVPGRNREMIEAPAATGGRTPVGCPVRAAADSHRRPAPPPAPTRIFMPAVTPTTIRPPFARYSHAFAVPPGATVVFVSGQLGVRPDDSVPEDPAEQAEVCFDNVAAILAAAGMTLADVVQVRAFVTERAHMAPYMAVRDARVATPPPASTLMIVSGFTRPEMKVEVEVIAARVL